MKYPTLPSTNVHKHHARGRTATSVGRALSFRHGTPTRSCHLHWTEAARAGPSSARPGTHARPNPSGRCAATLSGLVPRGLASLISLLVSSARRSLCSKHHTLDISKTKKEKKGDYMPGRHSAFRNAPTFRPVVRSHLIFFCFWKPSSPRWGSNPFFGCLLAWLPSSSLPIADSG